MVITTNKDTKNEKIEQALKKIKKSKKKSVSDFYGKLKGAFGNGLEYKQKMRDEYLLK